ncbi:hypothetical protein ABEF95_005077 [Exophiala dermatitidis]|uniref:Regulatory protein SWI5 n=1 Tax=Exophiala dermatitidis (strain ATCC 34100 / CBS 525.76 / NIH/UT8656) TaxID=858893 RepID=H6BLJ9_EXODN|nr:regulatory protein SWI5 [Exophiala dermatitidis NIH/UT8656]EHY51892.1 regulatory protein SWI5 [Exophiala dermatitidis NIH/UT8656]
MAEPSADPHISPRDPASASPTFVKPVSPLKTASKHRADATDDFEASSRPEKRPRLDAPSMTAAIAFAEEQEKAGEISQPSTGTSPNPKQQALQALMGTNQNAMSKALQSDPASDPATTVSEPLAVVAENIQQSVASTAGETSIGETHAAQTSPTSLSSVGTIESIPAASGITTTVGSPLPLDETARKISQATEGGSISPGEPEGSKAFSYPTPLLQTPLNDGARRGMSLPGSGTRQGTRSPSSKKHRCPYCATEFTRHHNLKSHLLTHSQEKPYVCSTCDLRFRRLHDLKRHTKLHTGERPHICPKCGRGFARGDALARHNKGPGGCPGRRTSMGSFAGDDDAEGDESMEGVMYNEPDALEDEEGNEQRPAIRRQAPSGDDTPGDPDHTSRIPSTYPPIQGRPPGGISGGFFPPRAGYSSTAAGAGNVAPVTAAPPGPLPMPQMSNSSSNSRPSGPGSTVFAQNPLTESPKPLSPGQTQRGSGPAPSENSLNRNRSPSVSHYQQSSYGRASGTSSSLSLSSGGPQLPPPNVLNPPDARYTLPSQGGPAHPPTQPSGPPTHMSGSGPLSSHSNSLSSHGHSAHGSGEASNPMFTNKDDRLWAYVTTLEQRMNAMQDEITSLKHQLAMATQAQQQQRI